MIETLKKSNKEILREIEQLSRLDEEDDEEDEYISKKKVSNILRYIKNSGLNKVINKVDSEEYFDNFKYSDLTDIHNKLDYAYNNISTVKDDIDLDIFFKKGKLFDFDKLRKKMNDKGIKKVFPNFNFTRYRQLIENPIFKITKSDGETIHYDKFVVKKILTAINQMIFDQQDLYIINAGKEGSGKSCWSTQLILYFYTFLKEVGLIDYEYDMKRMFFSSVDSLIEEQDMQENEDYFRIYCLDEAFGLNRQRHNDPVTMMFKDEMRRERKLLRINILNLPQLGELDTAITLSRTNFIFDCRMENKLQTGTLTKGNIDMYIVPRGKKIFSNYQKREITDDEIVDKLAEMMSKKSKYYKKIPRDLIIHNFKFSDKWGFDMKKYSEHIKNENKKKRMSMKKVKVPEYIAYIMYRKMPRLKHWGFDKDIKSERRMYDAMRKWFSSNIDMKFKSDVNLKRKYDIQFSSEEE